MQIIDNGGKISLGSKRNENMTDMRTYRMQITMDAWDKTDFANEVMRLKERELIMHTSPIEDFEDVVAENDLLKFILAINKIELTDEVIADAKKALAEINEAVSA